MPLNGARLLRRAPTFWYLFFLRFAEASITTARAEHTPISPLTGPAELQVEPQPDPSSSAPPPVAGTGCVCFSPQREHSRCCSPSSVAVGSLVVVHSPKSCPSAAIASVLAFVKVFSPNVTVAVHVLIPASSHVAAVVTSLVITAVTTSTCSQPSLAQAKDAVAEVRPSQLHTGSTSV